jgi:hypothetical protein
MSPLLLQLLLLTGQALLLLVRLAVPLGGC